MNAHAKRGQEHVKKDSSGFAQFLFQVVVRVGTSHPYDMKENSLSHCHIFTKHYTTTIFPAAV